MKPICVTNLSGGLGEGLQNFAFLYSFSKIFDLDYYIINIENWIDFNVNVPENSIRPAKDVTGWIEIFKDQEMVNLFKINNLEYHQPNFENKYINNIMVTNNDNYLNFKNSVDYNRINRLLGYNFDTRSWSNYKDDIKNCLNLNPYNIDEKITVVHVRRTDWPNAHWSFIDLCHTNYYINAINQAGNNFVVFVTDDIPWVKGWFSSIKNRTICKNVDFYDGNVIDSFNFMLGAQNLIISQSNFSRWPAYLGNANVYYPELFFKNHKTNDLKTCSDTVQFYLDDPKWRKIKYILRR
jgi:hypothetical protein